MLLHRLLLLLWPHFIIICRDARHVFVGSIILVDLTRGEDVGVEANVERRVADGADGFAGVEDDLAAFGICHDKKVKRSQDRTKYKHVKEMVADALWELKSCPHEATTIK